MTETTHSKKSAKKPPSAPQKKSASPATIVAWLALLGSIALAGVVSWQHHTLKAISIQSHMTSNAQLRENQHQNQTLISKIDSFDSKLQDQSTHINNLQAQLNLQLQRGENPGTYHQLELIYYLVNLASLNLSYLKKPLVAKNLLHMAMMAVESDPNPTLGSLQQELKVQLLALKGLERPDKTAILATLNGLMNNIPELSFVRQAQKQDVPSQTSQSPVTSKTYWKEKWSTLWSNLEKVIVIRRHQKPVEPLLDNQQDQFLKQNLQILLQQAIWHLLQDEGGAFLKTLGTLEGHLTGTFDDKATAVISFQQTLKNLTESYQEPSLPDLSKLLNHINALRHQALESLKTASQGASS